MKNYYDQKKEFIIVVLRIATLEEKKAMYFNKTQPSSPKFKEKVTTSHVDNDPFLNYVAKIEEIDKELELLYAEADMLEKYLGKMEDNLRGMKGTLEKVFVARYIDGLDVRKIAQKLNYSESHIYTLLKQVQKIVKNNNNMEI